MLCYSLLFVKQSSYVQNIIKLLFPRQPKLSVMIAEQVSTFQVKWRCEGWATPDQTGVKQPVNDVYVKRNDYLHKSRRKYCFLEEVNFVFPEIKGTTIPVV